MTAAAIKNARRRPAAMVDISLRGLAQGLVFGALAVLLAPLAGWGGGRALWARMLLAACAGWGKLTWWRPVALARCFP